MSDDATPNEGTSGDPSTPPGDESGDAPTPLKPGRRRTPGGFFRRRRKVDTLPTPARVGTQGDAGPMSDEHDPSAAGPDDEVGGADPASSGASDATTDAPKRKRFLHRHWILTAVGLVLLLVIGSSGGYLYWANQQLDEIPRFDGGIPDDPVKNHHEDRQALNILLLGADHGEHGQSVADDLKDGEWTPGLHLSDTIIVLHIPADRDSASMMSIPRDTWVNVDGSMAKINSAFEMGGPKLAYKTVQTLTGMTIDHIAVIDWAGFKSLTEAIGGVRVYVPETFYDDSQRITWEQGWQTLEGDRALQYVRTRHGIPGDTTDDFGRMARQQNFLRALMSQLLSSDTTHNPIKFTKVLNSIASYLTVDDTWDTDEIRNLAWSMRSIDGSKVDFLTAPLGSYATVQGQSIVRLDMPEFHKMISAILDDDVHGYLEKHPEARLGNDQSVN